MIKTDDTAIAVLNGLLGASCDAQLGYETAAADVSEPELGRIFREIAAQRSKFADELRERVKTLRAEPVKGGGSFAGAVHRTWMDVKAGSETARMHAVLGECVRADALAVTAYRKALQACDLDEQTRRLIQQQYEQVQAAHDRIRQLRDSPGYAYR